MKKKEQKKRDFSNFLDENKIIIILFLASTAFFLYQHAASFSWDFSVFVMNAKYWFAGGTYFEPFRTPIMPLLLTVFAIFGWAASEYIYIVIISAFFAYSSVKLADSMKINKNLFYILLLNPYLLRLGLANGTEMLSIAFLMLFIANIVSKKDSGHWLGLACLSRYNIVFFLPLIVLHKNIRKIIKNCIFFAIPFIPWFAYNYYKFGNIFMSIADSYANNIALRDYIHQSFNFLHLKMALNFLIPLVIGGIIYAIYLIIIDLRKNKTLKGAVKTVFDSRVGEIIMLVLFFATIYQYAGIPIKDVRYLFNLVLPAAYFSVLAINYVASKTSLKRIKLAFAIGAILLTLAAIPSITEYEKKNVYFDAIDKIESFGIGDCGLMSNAWVFLSYLGKTSVSTPWDRLVQHYIDRGHNLVFFYRTPEPEYSRNSTFMHLFPVIYENDKYIIIGNRTKCAPVQPVESTFLGAVNETVSLLYNRSIDTDACNVMFKGNTGRRICNLANLRWKN